MALSIKLEVSGSPEEVDAFLLHNPLLAQAIAALSTPLVPTQPIIEPPDIPENTNISVIDNPPTALYDTTEPPAPLLNSLELLAVALSYNRPILTECLKGNAITVLALCNEVIAVIGDSDDTMIAPVDLTKARIEAIAMVAGMHTHGIPTGLATPHRDLLEAMLQLPPDALAEISRRFSAKPNHH